MSLSSTNYTAHRIAASMREGDIWDVHTIDETWHIENKAKPNPGVKPPNTYDILNDAGTPVVPGIGEPYVFTGGTGKTWMESALVRSLSWTFGRGQGVDVTIQWSTRYFWSKDAKGMTKSNEDPSTATALTENLFLPCMVLPIFQSRNVKKYRDGAGMTNPSNTLDLSTSDIGGTRKMLDVDVKQIGYKLRMVIDTNSLGTVDVTDIVAQYLGKKNNAPFLGCVTGSLVCSGATINHLEHEFLELVMEYLYDEDYHQTQTPQIDTDNRPKNDGSGYSDVRWARVARTGVDFNDIWPTGPLGQSQKYQAFMGRWY